MSDYRRLRPPVLQGEAYEEELVCPKPRRQLVGVTMSTPELLKPIRQRRSKSPAGLDCEAGHEILEIFLSKNSCGDSPRFGCSPPYFAGSPPSRAGNPLVRDAQFYHQRPPPAPSVAAQTKSCNGPSFRPSPSVRVEGFDCAGRGFECTGRDLRCRVPAFA